MLVSEVRMVNVSVGSMDDALALYAGELGLEVVARGDLPPELSGPWRVPEGLPGKVALLAAGTERTGMLRLVEFGVPGDRIWTKADQLSGNGFWALNFRVHDIRALLPRLLEAGVTGSGEAKNWSITDEVAVWDSVTTDPDGVHLDIYSYERGAELRGGELHGRISPLQTIAICVHNLAHTRRFYEGLGYEVLWERTIAGLEDMLQIPAGVTLHDANLVRDPAILPGRVELFQFLDTGVVSLPEPAPYTPCGPAGPRDPVGIDGDPRSRRGLPPRHRPGSKAYSRSGGGRTPRYRTHHLGNLPRPGRGMHRVLPAGLSAGGGSYL